MSKFALILALTMIFALISGAPSKKFSLRVPKACENKPFCTIRPDGYDVIEDMINKLLSAHLNTNVADRYGPPPSTQMTETNVDNCPSIKSLQSYYMVRSPNSTKMDIVVQTKMFQQNVEVVKCAYELISYKQQNQQCFERLGLNLFNMRSSCQETSAIRSLLVLDPELKSIRQKNYTIPVCCSCKIADD